MDESAIHTVALVVPCFNEAGRLRPDAFEQALARSPRLRLLFVDDGSTDATVERIASLANTRPDRVEILRLDANGGKGPAVRAGVLRALARGCDVVGFWDADLSTPLEEMERMLDVLEGSPGLLAVFGSRVRLLGRDVRRSTLRHYVGRVFATAVSSILDVAIYDSQCGAKIFRSDRRTIELFETPFRARWIFDVEIVARLAEVARNVESTVEDLVHEHPVRTWHAARGSKLRPADYLSAVRDLAVIGWGHWSAARGRHIVKS